jgi:hypothetical protein
LTLPHPLGSVLARQAAAVWRTPPSAGGNADYGPDRSEARTPTWLVTCCASGGSLASSVATSSGASAWPPRAVAVRLQIARPAAGCRLRRGAARDIHRDRSSCSEPTYRLSRREVRHRAFAPGGASSVIFRGIGEASGSRISAAIGSWGAAGESASAGLCIIGVRRRLVSYGDVLFT